MHRASEAPQENHRWFSWVLYVGLSYTTPQVLEEENQNLGSQVAMLEDQLKMASIASNRKIQEVREQHKAIGMKMKELLKLHESLDSHLAV